MKLCENFEVVVFDTWQLTPVNGLHCPGMGIFCCPRLHSVELMGYKIADQFAKVGFTFRYTDIVIMQLQNTILRFPLS